METKDKQEAYKISPKGIAVMAMIRSGLIRSAADPRFLGFWELFESNMRKHGYASENSGECDED